MTGLLELPGELFITVAAFLGERDLLQLILSCPQAYSFLISTLYQDASLPLLWAAERGNERTIKNVFDYTSPPPLLLFYALTEACKYGHVNVVRRLLDSGAPVDRPDANSPEERDGGRKKTKPNMNGHQHGTFTPLWQATKHEHLQITEMLLEAGADPNRYTIVNCCRMFVQGCSTTDDLRIAKALLAHGFDITREQFLPNIIHENGGYELISLLLDHGADVSATDNCQATSLAIAVTASNVRRWQIVPLLLAHGAKTDIPDRWGTYPIHLAARHYNCSLLKKLLQAGASVDARNGSNMTALHIASNETLLSHRVLELLLDSGADLCASIGPGQSSILRTITSSGDPQIIRLFLDAAISRFPNVPSSDLMLAATVLADETTVTQLLKSHPSMDLLHETNNHGNNALMLAAGHGHDTIVRLLLPETPRIDIPRNSCRYSALQLAIWSRNLACVRPLLDRSPTTNRRDREGRTPLMLAVCENRRMDGFPNNPIVPSVEIAQELLVRCDNNKARDYDMWTPLHYAVEGGDIACVRLLLEVKGWRGSVNRNNCTPFMLAVMAEREDMVELFLEGRSGETADLAVRDEDGKTAVLQAVSKGNLSLVKRLVAHGFDLDAKGGFEWEDLTRVGSPLEVATMYGFDDIVEFLRESGAC
ncbi:Ankyrin-2 [Aspergillus nanangensis]|uniref:Ankyrin-2 n=1 Tax=Aspergillus nanangensis TaxID=2582783 RepID=A0AAD4CL72_ASPNN|nr:Ankyrin-2 [Aspergillus nanangensis]